MVVNNPEYELQQLGFSEYEAKAFVALVGKAAMSAYETAKISGIPSSKIYQVLDKLIAKQAAIRLEEGDKVLYTSPSIRDFLALQKESYNHTFTQLTNKLESLAEAREVSWVWNIRSYEEILKRVLFMIANASREIIISAYASEMAVIQQELEAASQRGVQIAIVHFGQTNYQLGTIYIHPIEDTLAAERGGRILTAVADQSIAINATIPGHEPASGAWSRNASFVLLAEDYIKHDIYLAKIVADFGPELANSYGERFTRLRDIFYKRPAQEKGDIT